MFKVKYLKTEEIMVPEKDSNTLWHNNIRLMIGFDENIYEISAGDGGLYIDDVSNEYELIIE